MTNRIHVALLRYVLLGDEGIPATEVDSLLATTEKDALFLKEFLLQHFREYCDIDVRGYIWSDDVLPFGPFNRHQPQAEGYFRSLDLDYQPTHWGIIAGSNPSYSGYANIGGDDFIVFANWGDELRRWAMCHEFGHLLDWHHANLQTADGQIVKYGDRFSAAGTAKASYGFSGLGRNAHGLPIKTKHIYESTTVTLCPSELHLRDVLDDEAQMVALVVPGQKTIFSEIRKGRGVYGAVKSEPPDSLYSRYLDKYGNTVLLDPPMALADQTWLLPNGVTVNYLSYDAENERARVRFEYPQEQE